MAVDLSRVQQLTSNAVRHYWQTLAEQEKKQGSKSKKKDTGGRQGATGGKQMNVFCHLVQDVLTQTGIPDSEIHFTKALQLPGYFRPTKKWDMIVLHEGVLLACVEFKSQKGPSFGNNCNNRAEEAVGVGHDLATAFREGAFGKTSPRPWAGWLMLVEDCPGSTRSVDVDEPHFSVFKEFEGASYMKRYELLLRKLVREQLYDSAALLSAKRTDAKSGAFSEPAADLTVRKMMAGLSGHITGYLAGK